MYFKRNIEVVVTYQGEDFALDCHTEHMLGTKKGQREWLYFCDRYGRTGTSQCFSALRFRIGGCRLHGMLSTDHLYADALLPDDTTDKAEVRAVDADGLTRKEEQAVRLLQAVSRGYKEPIEVGYSGGKDSDVILHLARRAAINIQPIYRNTTIDPPGTIAHVEEVGGVRMVRPERSFFQLIEQKGLPSRIRRYCCEKLKEYKIMEKTILGVRKSESDNRARNYSEPTKCLYYGRTETPENHVEGIYPILDWSDEDVLNYIERHSLKLHPLYYRKDGSVDVKRRLGCMCCPMIYWKRRCVEFRQHPKMVRSYCRAAQKHRETHPDTDAATKYSDVYQLFFRNVFFDTQEKWDKWLADNDASLFGIRDYRTYLEQYFNVSLPELPQPHHPFPQTMTNEGDRKNGSTDND